MCLRGNDREFLGPLGWWERMEAQKQFPVLCKREKMFLACPATSAPSERVWSQSTRVVTPAIACQSAKVTSATICLGENEEILRKHYSTVVKDIDNPAPLYMSTAGNV